jgi:RimJ/RimL family protein N-acetyltransferase
METLLHTPNAPSRRITSDVFSLRPFDDGDAPSLWQAIQDARSELQRWNGIGDKDRTLEEVRHRIAKWSDEFSALKRLQYGLIDASGTVLGGAALEHIDWQAGSFQLGYWLRPSAYGHGHVTRAAALLTREAFDKLAAKRVAIWTDAENASSIKVANRLGFGLEQRLARERRNAHGDWQDTLVFVRFDADGV